MSASAGACDAFLPARTDLKAADHGPLSGLTFAAKDLYDVRPTRPGRPASRPGVPSCLHSTLLPDMPVDAVTEEVMPCAD